MNRTDPHSPTNMDPTAYTFLGCYDNADPDAWAKPEPYKARLAAALSKLAALASEGRCTHCGAIIRYTAILRFDATGENILVGETCLDNRFALESKAEFDALRKAASEKRAEQRIVTKVSAWLTTLVGAQPEAVIDFLADKHDRKGHSEHLWYGVTQMRYKLWAYGYELSPKQLALVAKCLVEAEQAPVRIAAKAQAEAEAKASETMPPTGRVTVTGTILSTKWQDSDYGSTLKMLVDAGTYRLWGSVPSKLQVSKGDQVTFSADVTPKEIGFGFFKRPTQAKVLASQAAA